MADEAPIRARLLDFLVSLGLSEDDILTSTDLIGGGTLDSINAVSLIAFCEEELGLELEVDDMEGDFASFDKIVGLAMAAAKKRERA